MKPNCHNLINPNWHGWSDSGVDTERLRTSAMSNATIFAE